MIVKQNLYLCLLLKKNRNNLKVNYIKFELALRILLAIFLIGLVVFFIARLSFLFVYGSYSDLKDDLIDVVYAFAFGFRFDSCILAIGLVPLAIITIIQLFDFKYNLSQRLFLRIALYYSTFILLLYALITIADFYFYQFFNSHLSVLSFGLFDDDTNAVLKSIWTDYPIVKITMGYAIFCVLLFMLLRWMILRESNTIYLKSKLAKVLLVFLFIFLYVLTYRGGVFRPLNLRESSISKNSFVNNLTLNGCFSLKIANDYRRRYNLDTDIPKMLRQNGFNTPKEAIESYLFRVNLDTINLNNNLIATTTKDEFLEKNPPNVVFIQMESMNGHYFDFHSSTTNTLGKLETVLPDCYVFRNFIGGGRLTIYALEGLLAGSPIAPISQSEFQNKALTFSVSKTYKEHGYVTSFISGNSLSWRSLDKFLSNQNFDRLEGKPNLLEFYPEAKAGEWGVPDEFTFKRIFEILKNSKENPQFIYGFTISNHTPFDIPSTYKGYPLVINDDLKPKLRKDLDITCKNLLSYQYANSCLGQFIEDVKNSPMGDNTIIVATGDHSNSSLFNYTDKDMLSKLAVPLILYVPDKYKPKVNVDTKRFGSHKDIFPTVFSLSLSGAEYLNTGNNLFAEKGNFFGVFNCGIAMNSKGCVDFQYAPLYYKWDNAKEKSLVIANQEESLDSLCLNARAYVASMKFYIINDLVPAK